MYNTLYGCMADFTFLKDIFKNRVSLAFINVFNLFRWRIICLNLSCYTIETLVMMCILGDKSVSEK
ncbi:hypothetical protein GGR06_002759 [Bacteroides reticulotermitis]|uniref:Uncharacterized protein n=1 Tax=Bacteroides reticulotermitis TaxID=1133319 RepID=A0A840CXX8_9BACE|nr:hypothetical protein [Bacteroides reticulotermitis]